MFHMLPNGKFWGFGNAFFIQSKTYRSITDVKFSEMFHNRAIRTLYQRFLTCSIFSRIRTVGGAPTGLLLISVLRVRSVFTKRKIVNVEVMPKLTLNERLSCMFLFSFISRQWRKIWFLTSNRRFFHWNFKIINWVDARVCMHMFKYLAKYLKKYVCKSLFFFRCVLSWI